MNKYVAASILGSEDKVSLVNKLLSKGLEWIHYDVMDGMFVPAKSLPLDEIKYVFKNTNEHIKDVHLMVNDPLKYIEELVGKANYITFHYEAESIERIKKIFKNYSHKYNIGISIKPKTNVEQIYEFLHDCSHVLIMTVEPGLGGQSFMDDMMQKVIKVKEYLKKINREEVFVQVDGGINNITGPIAANAGATNFVSGSFLIKNIDLDSNILKKITG